MESTSNVMTGRPVVVIGPASDEHVAAIAARVRGAGAPVVILDPDEFPGRSRLTLGDAMDDVWFDGRRLTPASVYVRRVVGPPLPPRAGRSLDEAEYGRLVAIARERDDLLAALVARWAHAGVPTYNNVLAARRIAKPFQLALLRASGLPVPETRWTNDPDEVRRLASGRRVAYKPVVGGARTRELSPENDLVTERLSRLRVAPVTFQELLDGEEVRVYVLDGAVIAAIRITSRELDYRQHEDALESVTLPPELVEQCTRAADVVGLRFTGMDLKRGSDGVARFLELNSSPMFLGFDTLAGTEIARHLAERLAAHAGLAHVATAA